MSAQIQIVEGPWQSPTGSLNVLEAISLDDPVTPGNTVIVEVNGEGTRTVAINVDNGVVDDDSTAYGVRGTDAAGGSGRIGVRSAIAGSVDAGQNVIVTLSGNSGDRYQVILREVEGLLADQSGIQSANIETASGTTHTGNSLTPPGSTDFALVSVMRGNRSYTEDPDFDAATTGTNLVFSGSIENPVGAVQISFTSDSSTTALIHSLIFVGEAAGDPPPDVTDVDTDESVATDQTNVVGAGTALDLASVEIRQGAVAVTQSLDSDSGTAFQYDMVFATGGGPHLKHGSAVLAGINADDQEDTIAITITAASGHTYVDIDTPDPEADNRITAIPDDLESGDQLWALNAVGGDISDLTLNDDGTFSVEVGTITQFDVRHWRAATATWSAPGTQYVNARHSTTQVHIT